MYNICKLDTKSLDYIKSQHEKKYLMNCSLRVYQRIIILKYRESRYLSMFCFNRPVYLYKS